MNSASRRLGVLLPDWPAHCRAPVAHAELAVGKDAVVMLKTERAQLDFANQRAANCGAHYDELQKLIAKATG
jgi:hypothetical protein